MIKNKKKKMIFNSFPKTIIEYILVFIPLKNDIVNCCLVEKKWNLIIKNSKLIWRNVFNEMIKGKLSLDVDKFTDDPELSKLINFNTLISFWGIFFLFIKK
jgi:hypothetical protein